MRDYGGFFFNSFADQPENVRIVRNAIGKVCTGVEIKFTCTAEANPPVHTYLLYENDTVITNMGIPGIWIRTMENAGQFVFRCEANNSIQRMGKSDNTILTVYGEFEVTVITEFSCIGIGTCNHAVSSSIWN